MSRHYLTKLRIEGFRGINNEGQPLELRFDKDKVNSIYALNGLGKSSVYDALCYAILGKVPKLDNLEQSEAPESYVNNRFHTTATATIELTFVADNGGTTTQIKVERAKDGTRTVSSPTEANPESFLVALRSDFVLLDQSTFGQFINDTSLKRGRTFARLLGLSRLSDYRIALQKLTNEGTLSSDLDLPTLRANEASWNQQSDRLTASLRIAYDQLTGKPYAGTIDYQVYSLGVIEALKQIPTLQPFCSVVQLHEIDFSEVEKAVSEAEKSTDRDRLAKIREAVILLKQKGPSDSEEYERSQLGELIAKRDEALAKTTGSLLLNNYRTALEVLNSGAWDDPLKCPTCEAKQQASLLDALRAKLSAFDNAEAATEEIKVSWKAAEWPKRLRELERNEHIKPVGDARDYDRLSPYFTNGAVTAEQLAEATTSLDTLEQRRKDAIQQFSEEIARLEATLPASMVAVTRQVSIAKQAAADISNYHKLQPLLAKVRKQIQRRKEWKDFINNAYRDFTEAEATWVANRQQMIATDCQSIHEAITRNRDVVPNLDRPVNSERLQLRLDQFYGLTNLSANTLLQESYCNAIAISIFLSTALKCPTPARFIVLDDVTSSFDGGHQFQLMELLRCRVSPSTNPDGLQIILLTHDTLLEKYLDKATQTGTWRHQKLIGTPPNGPVLTEQHNANHVRQRAENYLNTGQTEAAGPWIRQYLEAVLSRIIRKADVRVPLDYAMDDNKKMVQNALDAIKDQMDLNARAGSLVLTQQQIQDASATLVPSLLANFCTHYNTGAFAGISARVLIGVLDDVDKLEDCFRYDCTCKQQGQTVRRFYRNLKSKACNC